VTAKAAATANTRSAQPNHGLDDSRGEYLRVVPGDHIAFRYEIMEVLGAGSFGQVVRCYDHATKATVAVKMVRNKRRFKSQVRARATPLGRGGTGGGGGGGVCVVCGGGRDWRIAEDAGMGSPL
jgi:hypothetical protein